jgi:pyruvate carboxylase
MKISAWGITRKTTINRLKVALQETIISGCVTNISFLLKIFTLNDFKNGTYGIRIIEKMKKSYYDKHNFIYYLVAVAIKKYNINKYRLF